MPLMLDESIGGEEDLRRASGIPNVRYVKFKLMKSGSIARLRRLMARAAALGLGVVVGNGVAADIGSSTRRRRWPAPSRSPGR